MTSGIPKAYDSLGKNITEAEGWGGVRERRRKLLTFYQRKSIFLPIILCACVLKEKRVSGRGYRTTFRSEGSPTPLSYAHDLKLLYRDYYQTLFNI